MTAEGERLVVRRKANLAQTGYAAGAHATSHNRSMRGHAATRGKNTLGVVHTFNIFRGRLLANQDDIGTLTNGPLGGILSSKNNLASRSAGRSGQALTHNLCCFQFGNVELRVKESVDLLGIDRHDSLLPGNGVLIH